MPMENSITYLKISNAQLNVQFQSSKIIEKVTCIFLNIIPSILCHLPRYEGILSYWNVVISTHHHHLMDHIWNDNFILKL